MSTKKYQVKNCIIDLSEFTIAIEGKKAKKLTKEQAIILECMIEQKESVATFEIMEARLKKARKITENEADKDKLLDPKGTIRSHISKIRKKIGSNVVLIENVRGVGYKLTDKLHKIGEDDCPSLPIETVPKTTGSPLCESSDVERDRFFRITTCNEYREFLLEFMKRYYGNTFLTEINGISFMASTIPAAPVCAKQGIQDMDELICPKDQLMTNASDAGCFNAADHNHYKALPYYDSYENCVGGRIHFPDRPGYMMDRIHVNEAGMVESISAHVGTYAENVYGNHAAEYELYHVYNKFNLNGKTGDELKKAMDNQWEEIHQSVTLRNSIHGDVGRNGEEGFAAKMSASLRDYLGDNSLIGVEMLVIVRNRNGEDYKVLIGQRSNSVAMFSGTYEFPPAGGFEILNDSPDGIYDELELISDYSPGGAVFREYLEELIRGCDNFDGTGTGGIGEALLADREILQIQDLIKSDKAVFQFLGCSIDLILIRANLDFVLVIDDPVYVNTHQFITNDEYKKGRVVDGVTVNNIEKQNVWKSHHGPSATMWHLFKQTELYKKLVEELA